MEIKFVAMEKEHLTQVLELAEASGLSFWSRRDYEAEISRKDSLCITALDSKKKIAGFLVARLIKSVQYCELNNIAVKNELKQLGIGTKLIDILVKSCERYNLTKILLELRESNKTAFKFYSRLGFKLLGRRKDFYRNPPEDGLTMIKDLSQIDGLKTKKLDSIL